MPHFMKRVLSILVFGGVLLLAACSSKGVEEAKPGFAFSHIVVNPFSQGKIDTVTFKLNDKNIYVLDSVNQFDSVAFTVALLGYSDNLTHFSLARDWAEFQLALADTLSLKKYLIDSQSNVRQGELYFITGYTAITLPFFGVPQTTGHTDFSFTLESESPLSPNQITLRLPVR